MGALVVGIGKGPFVLPWWWWWRWWCVYMHWQELTLVIHCDDGSGDGGSGMMTAVVMVVKEGKEHRPAR